MQSKKRFDSIKTHIFAVLQLVRVIIFSQRVLTLYICKIFSVCNWLPAKCCGTVARMMQPTTVPLIEIQRQPQAHGLQKQFRLELSLVEAIADHQDFVILLRDRRL